MASFAYQPRTGIRFGVGAIDQLGESAREAGGRRALLVSDPGVAAVGHTERGRESLRSAGIAVVLFADVDPNPTTEHVESGVAVAREAGIDLIVGLGGGSAMDCAKGINFLLTNGGAMQDYWGVGKATKPMLPMIAVPTTAGTGSEAQSFALITDPDTRTKMACGDKKAACRMAILDPALTVSQPRSVTVATGIDAAAHAIESFVTRQRNPVSNMLAREAWRQIGSAFGDVLARPDDLAARGAMLWGAHLAGAAIEQSMLGAAHACANPLTKYFGIIHGFAVGIMLPHVIRFNADSSEFWYSELAALGAMSANQGESAAEGLARRVEGMLRGGGVRERLGEYGVAERDLPKLAADAAGQWTGRFNPRPADAEAYEALYRAAL